MFTAIPLLALGAGSWVAGFLWIFLLDDPRLRYPAFAGAWLLASIGWLVLIRVGTTPHPRWVGPLVVALGIGARIWALTLPPALSEDVFRYVYEGRLVWVLGPGAPFQFAPAMGPELSLPPGLLDEAWLRINHPELSTIYPPVSQLAFALAGGLGELVGRGHLIILKGILVAADLGTWWFLHRTLCNLGRPAHASWVWGMCPLVILEVAREGHADSLSALGLAISIWGFTAARPPMGYVGFALAALAKLNGLVVLPAAIRITRRGLLPAAILLMGLATPFILAGTSAGEGLSAYAQRWRAGDGAFSLLLWMAEGALGGDWARFGEWTITRHQLARLMTAAILGVGSLLYLRRSYPETRIPDRAGTLLLALLLFAPTLHPWYLLWVLPFATAAEGFRGRRAICLGATLAVCLHHPGWLELTDGKWQDLAELRALVHIPVWLMWVWDLVTSPRLGYPRNAPNA